MTWPAWPGPWPVSAERCRRGLAEWRYHGRLVARQLDDAHVVIRADFDYRDSLLRQFPGTFSVPARYIKHMMVVADLAEGDAVPSRMPSRQRGSFSAAPAGYSASTQSPSRAGSTQRAGLRS